ncbi:MAG: hypothetical protein RLZZ214_4051, partial [Verrucomicrobiota bacterium]
MRLRRRIKIGLAFLLVLLLAATWPVYLGFRKWDLRRGEQAARQALAAGDFS